MRMPTRETSGGRSGSGKAHIESRTVGSHQEIGLQKSFSKFIENLITGPYVVVYELLKFSEKVLKLLKCLLKVEVWLKII